MGYGNFGNSPQTCSHWFNSDFIVVGHCCYRWCEARLQISGFEIKNLYRCSKSSWNQIIYEPKSGKSNFKRFKVNIEFNCARLLRAVLMLMWFSPMTTNRYTNERAWSRCVRVWENDALVCALQIMSMKTNSVKTAYTLTHIPNCFGVLSRNISKFRFYIPSLKDPFFFNWTAMLWLPFDSINVDNL